MAAFNPNSIRPAPGGPGSAPGRTGGDSNPGARQLQPGEPGFVAANSTVDDAAEARSVSIHIEELSPADGAARPLAPTVDEAAAPRTGDAEPGLSYHQAALDMALARADAALAEASPSERAVRQALEDATESIRAMSRTSAKLAATARLAKLCLECLGKKVQTAACTAILKEVRKQFPRDPRGVAIDAALAAARGDPAAAVFELLESGFRRERHATLFEEASRRIAGIPDARARQRALRALAVECDIAMAERRIDFDRGFSILSLLIESIEDEDFQDEAGSRLLDKVEAFIVGAAGRTDAGNLHYTPPAPDGLVKAIEWALSNSDLAADEANLLSLVANALHAVCAADHVRLRGRFEIALNGLDAQAIDAVEAMLPEVQPTLEPDAWIAAARGLVHTRRDHAALANAASAVGAVADQLAWPHPDAASVSAALANASRLASFVFESATARRTGDLDTLMEALNAVCLACLKNRLCVRQSLAVLDDLRGRFDPLRQGDLLAEHVAEVHRLLAAERRPLEGDALQAAMEWALGHFPAAADPDRLLATLARGLHGIANERAFFYLQGALALRMDRSEQRDELIQLLPAAFSPRTPAHASAAGPLKRKDAPQGAQAAPVKKPAGDAAP